MSREILFRGKTAKGEWVEGFYTKGFHNPQQEQLLDLIYIFSKEREWEFDYELVIPETVGQFTGLTDKNGKKIFEGDIVKATYDCECEKTYQVIFFNGGYKMKANDCHTVYDYSIHEEHPDFEVIGNIHDNPELLKGNNYEQG